MRKAHKCKDSINTVPERGPLSRDEVEADELSCALGAEDEDVLDRSGSEDVDAEETIVFSTALSAAINLDEAADADS